MSAAFHSLPATSGTPLFVFGDHASKTIPPEYNNLGLTGADLTRHIAWDIGTETIVRGLTDHFGCAGQLAGVSRLVIDVNRDVVMHDLIPPQSDGTQIPRNIGIDEREKSARIERFHIPYHHAMGQALDKVIDPLVLSIHSFTPHPLTGAARATEIGLLVKQDIETAKAFLDALKTRYNMGWNKPYSAFDLAHTIDTNIAVRGLRHLAIEVRQDLVDSEPKARAMTNVLCGAIAPLIRQV